MEGTSGILFKTSLLDKFALIDSPGKYNLTVLNNVSEKNLFTDDKGSRYIVNLKAIAKDKAQQVAETFAGQESVAIEETNGLFMTASIWKPEGQSPSLPMKGEEVEVTVGYVASQEGEEVLRVTNIRVNSAKTASKFSFAAVAAHTNEITQPA